MIKSDFAKRNLVSFVVGLTFGVGLVVSGMTQPQKIIAFLDPWNWDPSLLFVMMGAVGVHAAFYPMIRGRATPFLDTKWHIPDRNDLTFRLLVGSALFGIGWGIGGYCPGPGITGLANGGSDAFGFVSMMLLGMLVFKKIDPFIKFRK